MKQINKIKYWVIFVTFLGVSMLISYLVILKSYPKISPWFKELTSEYPDFIPNLQEPKPIKVEIPLVSEVIDGDTVILNTQEHVRYIGINAPEIGDCFYEEAKKANETLVFMKSNNELSLEQDYSEKDKYGRLLRYAYVNYIPYDTPESKKQIFVNEYLVKYGFARAIAYPPDTKYQEVLKEAQNYAKENNLGLWQTCQN